MAEAKKKTRKRTPTKKKTGGGRRTGKKLPEGMSMEELMHIRAYEIFEERSSGDGPGGGDQLADWCQAEREILEEYQS